MKVATDTTVIKLAKSAATPATMSTALAKRSPVPLGSVSEAACRRTRVPTAMAAAVGGTKGGCVPAAESRNGWPTWRAESGAMSGHGGASSTADVVAWSTDLAVVAVDDGGAWTRTRH